MLRSLEALPAKVASLVRLLPVDLSLPCSTHHSVAASPGGLASPLASCNSPSLCCPNRGTPRRDGQGHDHVPSLSEEEEVATVEQILFLEPLPDPETAALVKVLRLLL